MLRAVVLQPRQIKITAKTPRKVGMYRCPFFLAGRKSVEVQDAIGSFLFVGRISPDDARLVVGLQVFFRSLRCADLLLQFYQRSRDGRQIGPEPWLGQ